jgi:hypothetical protein
MVDSSISHAKVMLFGEINNILTENLSQNFHFVTMRKDFGQKYNKMKRTTFITKKKISKTI